MKLYLVTYTNIAGEFIARMCTMEQVARIVGFRDCSNDYGIKVYDVLRNGVHELVVADFSSKLLVTLADKNGFNIDEAHYPEH